MIHIEGNVYISADANCYSLSEKRIAGAESKNPGEEYVVPLNSYHTTASGALKAYIRIKQRKWTQENDASLTEALKAFENIENSLGKVAQ